MVVGRELKGLTDCTDVGATALIENFLMLDDLVKLLYGTTACTECVFGGRGETYQPRCQDSN